MQNDVARRGPAEFDIQRRRARTLVAWERFAAGDDEAATGTVPPPILLSWHRCRDVHRLDPVRAIGSVHSQSCGGSQQRYGGVQAQLGDIAAAIVGDVGGCLATVTDGDGRILATWSTRELERDASAGKLEPQFLWPESTSGTNGMGTALLQPAPAVVRGPEHWRQEMHEWTCLGLAIFDPVTEQPVAALNISSYSEIRVTDLTGRLINEFDAPRRYLRHRSIREAMAVAERFSAADTGISGKLIALDLAGNIIAASEDVRKVVDDVPRGFLLEPASRRGTHPPRLRRVAEESFVRATADPSWCGTAVLGPPLCEKPEIYSVMAVNGPAGLAGWILSGQGDASGSDHRGNPPEYPISEHEPGRIPAVAGDSVLLLDPNEIRFAEADRHVVWLVTDCGRFRAATKGMDHVELELGRHGFLRVHRSFLINPRRVRRVHHKGNGLITLSTDFRRAENIPVSRRSTHAVRRRLGL